MPRLISVLLTGRGSSWEPYCWRLRCGTIRPCGTWTTVRFSKTSPQRTCKCLCVGVCVCCMYLVYKSFVHSYFFRLFITALLNRFGLSISLFKKKIRLSIISLKKHSFNRFNKNYLTVHYFIILKKFRLITLLEVIRLSISSFLLRFRLSISKLLKRFRLSITLL